MSTATRAVAARWRWRSRSACGPILSTETSDAPVAARHDRVWLDPATWRAHLRAIDETAVEALHDWIVRGRAVVGRRRDSADLDACCVGVALPLAAGRRRVAFVVDRRAVVRVGPPMTLVDAIAHAPLAWRVALADLARRGSMVETNFRIFGSLAWQAISGEPCVGPSSDVDLLWSADGDDRIRRMLELLVEWEARHGLRPDGELLLANGDGIAWRELLDNPRRVLVKHQDRVSLQPSPLGSGLPPKGPSRAGSP